MLPGIKAPPKVSAKTIKVSALLDPAQFVASLHALQEGRLY
jgi:hypothetical protein